MNFRSWWHSFRRPQPVVQPEPTPVTVESEKIVAAATIFEVLATDDDMHKSDLMFRNALWARGEVESMLGQLQQHIMQGDHSDPMDCDVWCLPSPVARRIDSLTSAHIVILYVTLMKSYIVLAAQHQRCSEPGSDA